MGLLEIRIRLGFALPQLGLSRSFDLAYPEGKYFGLDCSKHPTFRNASRICNKNGVLFFLSACHGRFPLPPFLQKILILSEISPFLSTFQTPSLTHNVELHFKL